MKLLVASDIHGSIKYARKLIEVFEKEKADQILLLGDILYHGPRNDLPEEYNPKEVFLLLSQYKEKIWAVRGNCDAEVDEMVLEFDLMSDYRLFHIDGLDIIASHGHVYHPEHIPLHSTPVLFLYGHTHVAVAERKGNDYIGNPGSISLPKSDTNSYGILENKKWLIKDLDGKVIRHVEIDFQ